MFIRNIKVSNFKSFEEIGIDLGKFNVLVGANASGKSNFISIFKFLKDIVDSGLDNAISMQGGIDYIRNINIGASQNLSIELSIDSTDVLPIPIFKEEKDKKFIGISPLEFFYRLSIEFHKKETGYKVAEERMVTDLKFVTFEIEDGKMKELRFLEKGKFVISKDDENIGYELQKNISQDLRKKIIPFLLNEIIFKEKLFGKKLLLESEVPLLFIIDSLLKNFLRDIQIYNFDPRLSKLATHVTGKTELESDGSNLAIVLRNILESKENAEKFSDIVKSVLPFIEKVSIEKLADKSLIASLEETYSRRKFLPAFLISDGTINITALIIALYFGEKPLVIIEEPERNIHPYLISRIIDMMKDTSEEAGKQQIIVTTHNPEVVKYADTDHLLFIFRDENGFSRISRPSEKEEVKTFLENDIGIEELYAQNLLQW